MLSTLLALTSFTFLTTDTNVKQKIIKTTFQVLTGLGPNAENESTEMRAPKCYPLYSLVRTVLAVSSVLMLLLYLISLFSAIWFRHSGPACLKIGYNESCLYFISMFLTHFVSTNLTNQHIYHLLNLVWYNCFFAFIVVGFGIFGKRKKYQKEHFQTWVNFNYWVLMIYCAIRKIHLNFY